MSNGTMKVNDGKFSGQILTRSIHLNFWLEKQDQITAQSPTHKIMAKAPAGYVYQSGVAWERAIKRGDAVGQTMISLLIEDPDYGDKAVYFSAFPSRDGWDIKLERNRVEAEPVAAAA